MKYLSTRDKQSKLFDFEKCIQLGLAEDGGLFVPDKLEDLNIQTDDFSSTCTQLFKHFCPGFEDTAATAFDFPIDLSPLEENSYLLELFHGPTAAFKDFGARFLARCFEKMETHTNILVATSGDTGGAVASAFEGVPGVQVFLLYPEKGVSELQRHQLSCWGPNIHSFAVDGSFDNCQSMVKMAIAALRDKISISSANSINIGRLIPQMSYYFWSSSKLFKKHQVKFDYIIPCGNLGNSMAAIWAKRSGAPIGEIILALNSNKAISEFFESGNWQPMPTVSTIANAMDVGNPSNIERFLHLYPDTLPDWISARSISDSQIKTAIASCHATTGKVICPHTATAYAVWESLAKKKNSVLVSTASAAKFREVVEPVIQKDLILPDSLQDILKRKTRVESISTDLDGFTSRVLNLANS